MNPIEETVSSAIEKLTKQTESIICGAFEKHFGFPLSEVKDKENLDRLVELGNPIQTYRYRGEVFLYLAEGTPQIDGDQITWTSRVLEV